ncbi:hypothetical protein [Streptomyces sp. UG1]|uniref:hypothetical protein n=1 Tax=Streptomyces sp. UG1 TaxID=3417652 RepID=UPI003CFB879F
MSTTTATNGNDDEKPQAERTPQAATGAREAVRKAAARERARRQLEARHIKAHRDKRRRQFDVAIPLLALGLAAAVVFVENGQLQRVNIALQGVISWIILGACVILLPFAISWLLTRRQYMENQNKQFDQALKAQEEYEREVLEKLQKETELATLMGLNQAQIGEYHRIVTEQADKAFKSSRTAMGVGLFLLVCAAVAGAYVPLEEVRWFIGALAAFSTVLTAYLTKTYLTMYKESIGQLNRYFDQPVLNSHYLTAERLAERLDGEAAIEVRRQIINEVLATSSRAGANGSASKQALNGGKPKRRKVPKQQTGSASNGQGA